ncbi:retrovirus-related pol polyprotein from transposon TNT 1-94 [Tanacetum coccineum]
MHQIVIPKEREQYHEIQDLKAQMQDKNMVINELKKLILVTKGKSVETQFDKPSVVRQPNAQRIPKPSVLGKPTPFSNSPEMRKCGKCVFNSNHDACVSRYLKDVNARTKKPQVVPISASKPKRKVNKSVATPHKKIVASDTTIQKSKSYYKELYENTNQEWKWGYHTRCPTDCTTQPIHVDSGFAPFMIWCLNHGNVTSNGKSTCFVRDLQGNDLLTGSRGSDLYTISLQETTSSTPICFMAKASPTQAWLWHRRLSHLNFDYITLLSKKDVVTGLPKLTYVKDQLCSSCEMSKAKRSSFKSKAVPSSKGRLNLLHMDLCVNELQTINGRIYSVDR